MPISFTDISDSYEISILYEMVKIGGCRCQAHTLVYNNYGHDLVRVYI